MKKYFVLAALLLVGCDEQEPEPEQQWAVIHNSGGQLIRIVTPEFLYCADGVVYMRLSSLHPTFAPKFNQQSKVETCGPVK